MQCLLTIYNPQPITIWFVLIYNITDEDLQMSCLTRKLQQKLTRYLQRNSASLAANSPACIRDELVKKGLCPSDVTPDQVRLILQEVSSV